MIRYTVVWQRDAENDLTTLWCDQTNRRAISEAADRIDVELGVDPEQKGISLPEGLWELSIPPLAVGYHIEEADRKVVVVMIKLIQ